MFFSDECSFYNAHGDLECYKVCLICLMCEWMDREMYA